MGGRGIWFLRVVGAAGEGAAIVFGSLTMAGLSAARCRFQPMLTGGLTSQPIGHYEFCKANPAECSYPLRDPGPLHLTGALWKEIVAVNTASTQRSSR